MAEKPEDLNLPASVVARIVKDALPEGVNVSKEAKSAIARAASIFILYATTCANSHAIKGKRKTIMPNDLLRAVEDMEFTEFLPEMKECLEAFKKEAKEKKEAAANRKRKLEVEGSMEGPATAAPKSIATNDDDNSETVAIATNVLVAPSNDFQESMETEMSPQILS